ncbi:MAG: colicin V production CvpA [Rhodobacteraceae bacterium]|nr:colicin V production CvpA [Paracoccaceae bacterium]
MEGFNIVDGAIFLIVLLSALLAYARGIVREIMAILGWIAAAFVAFIFAPQVKPLVKEIPIIGPIISDSCELSIIASFAGVFAIALVIFSFFTPLLTSVINKTGAGSVDRAFGFLFGVFRGVALIAIMFFAYKSIFSAETFPTIDKSRSAVIFGNVVTNIEGRNPERALGWITEQYEQLVNVCNNE